MFGPEQVRTSAKPGRYYFRYMVNDCPLGLHLICALGGGYSRRPDPPTGVAGGPARSPRRGPFVALTADWRMRLSVAIGLLLLSTLRLLRSETPGRVPSPSPGPSRRANGRRPPGRRPPTPTAAGAPTIRRQEAREVGAFTQLGDGQLDRAGARLPGSIAVAVALDQTLGTRALATALLGGHESLAPDPAC